MRISHLCQKNPLVFGLDTYPTGDANVYRKMQLFSTVRSRDLEATLSLSSFISPLYIITNR